MTWRPNSDAEGFTLSATCHRGGHQAQIFGGFYIFIFFILVFYKNIFLFSKLTEIYSGRPAVERPEPGRPAAGRQGLFYKKFTLRLLEDRSPAGWAASATAAGGS